MLSDCKCTFDEVTLSSTTYHYQCAENLAQESLSFIFFFFLKIKRKIRWLQIKKLK